MSDAEGVQAMEAQEVFDTVVAKLREQGRPSIDPTSPREDGGHDCMYRSPDGCKCAAGHLISDEEYFPSMESITFRYLVQDYRNNLQHLISHEDLISQLQECHDWNWQIDTGELDNVHFVETLIQTAQRHGLDPKLATEWLDDLHSKQVVGNPESEE